MKQILAVMQKEVKEILSVRASLVMGTILSILFALTYGLTLARASLGGALFLLAPMLGVFMAYTFDTQVFLREKMDKVIETVLCTPLSLQQILAGKVLAVSLVSWLVTLIAMATLTVTAGLQAGHLALPPLAIMAHLLAVVPVFIAAFAALYGLLQFAFGLRENRFLGFIVFVPLFVGMTMLPALVGEGLTASWALVGLVLLGSLLLGLLGIYLSRFVSRERIVTTLT